MITEKHIVIAIVALIVVAIFWLNAKLSVGPEVPNASPKPVTLRTLKALTAQEVFNWVIYNLLKQNGQSYTTGVCAYRGENGGKCGAGWCIGDDEYSEDFEGEIWIKLVRYDKVPAQHSMLIADLQKLHDNNHPDKWYGVAIDVAAKHVLEIEFLESIKPV